MVFLFAGSLFFPNFAVPFTDNGYGDLWSLIEIPVT